MIQLKNDCLVFQTDNGEHIPCSAESVTFELMGEGAQLVDPELVRHASAAVLHYFKHELNRQSVSVGEFALALEKVLRSFGLSVSADPQVKPPAKPCAPQPQHCTSQFHLQTSHAAPQVMHSAEPSSPSVLEFDLTDLASNAASEGFELLFFPQLREELRRNLVQSPSVLRFHGLRACVKQLEGARRWSQRCQKLHDQIVEFLRSCWETEPARRSCALMVV
jgi:hypothetical protein